MATAPTATEPNSEVGQGEQSGRPDPSLRRRVLLTRLSLLLFVVLGWELASGPHGVSGTLIADIYVSKPTDILVATANWIGSGLLWISLWVTIQETIIGFALGCLAGLTVGFALGTNEFLSRVFQPVVTALNAIPRLALIPLFLLWFGLGIPSKIAVVVVIVFFLVFYSTYQGARDVPEELKEQLQLMGASTRQIHQKVTLPSAMTWIIAGLRVSVPYSVVAAVTAEMVASNRGMGYLIFRSSQQFYTAGVFAGIFVLVVFSLFLNSGVTALERYLLRWKSPGG